MIIISIIIRSGLRGFRTAASALIFTVTPICVERIQLKSTSFQARELHTRAGFAAKFVRQGSTDIMADLTSIEGVASASQIYVEPCKGASGTIAEPSLVI